MILNEKRAERDIYAHCLVYYSPNHAMNPYHRLHRRLIIECPSVEFNSGARLGSQWSWVRGSVPNHASGERVMQPGVVPISTSPQPVVQVSVLDESWSTCRLLTLSCSGFVSLGVASCIPDFFFLTDFVTLVS